MQRNLIAAEALVLSNHGGAAGSLAAVLPADGPANHSEADGTPTVCMPWPPRHSAVGSVANIAGAACAGHEAREGMDVSSHNLAAVDRVTAATFLVARPTGRPAQSSAACGQTLKRLAVFAPSRVGLVITGVIAPALWSHTEHGAKGSCRIRTERRACSP